jgi:polysaccharide pyruvyl transferase WcaK-like protein
MKNIDVKIGGYNNKGDGLMLLAIIDKLGSLDCRLVVKPHIADYKERAKLGLYQKLSSTQMSEIKNKVARALISPKVREFYGLILNDEIDVAIDSSGYSYSEKWGRIKIEKARRFYKSVKERGGKVILLPQTFGPFGENTKSEFEEMCKYVDLICARDQKSFSILESLDIDFSKIRLYPDFTRNISYRFCIDSEFVEKHSNLDVVIIPNHRMVDELGGETARQYIEMLNHSIEFVKSQGLRISMLFHEKEDFVRFMPQFENRNDIQFIYHEDPLVLRKIISFSKFVISSRFHGILTSFSSNIPCIGTSWAHKFNVLFEEYSSLDFLIQPHEIKRLEELIIKLIDPEVNKSQSSLIRERGEYYQTKVDLMWTEVKDILEN